MRRDRHSRHWPFTSLNLAEQPGPIETSEKPVDRHDVEPFTDPVCNDPARLLRRNQVEQAFGGHD